MTPQKCSGRDAITGEPVTLTFDRTLLSIDAAAEPADCYLAPGFIDLQVNGFAGVDYNRPGTPHEDIERSLQAQFATGVTRLYPTVITGPPDAMLACLRNLADARNLVVEQ